MKNKRRKKNSLVICSNTYFLGDFIEAMSFDKMHYHIAIGELR